MPTYQKRRAPVRTNGLQHIGDVLSLVMSRYDLDTTSQRPCQHDDVIRDDFDNSRDDQECSASTVCCLTDAR